jgi:hypothetical protein
MQQMNDESSIEFDFEVIEEDDNSMEIELKKTTTSSETSSFMSGLSSNVEKKNNRILLQNRKDIVNSIKNGLKFRNMHHFYKSVEQIHHLCIAPDVNRIFQSPMVEST